MRGLTSRILDSGKRSVMIDNLSDARFELADRISDRRILVWKGEISTVGRSANEGGCH